MNEFVTIIIQFASEPKHIYVQPKGIYPGGITWCWGNIIYIIIYSYLIIVFIGGPSVYYNYGSIAIQLRLC